MDELALLNQSSPCVKQGHLTLQSLKRRKGVAR